MIALLGSFFAGALTVAAPCVLPVLPVILGGSILTPGKTKNLKGPISIILGLVASVIVFTLLLKATTSLLGVPQSVWQIISATILFIFGLSYLFPNGWAKVMHTLGLQQKSDALLQTSTTAQSPLKDFFTGAALGPVFNSCSPTYGLIVAVILPRSFGEGLFHLISYALGLGIALFIISLFGRAVTQKLRVVAKPDGAFRKSIGALFILVSLLILTGYDKVFQAFVLEKGWYDPIANLERKM